MAHWAAPIPTDIWAAERLFHHETLTVPTGDPAVRPSAPDGESARPAVGDDVLLLADGAVVAQARVTQAGGGEVTLAYLRRAFDQPIPADLLDLAAPISSPFTPIGAEAFAEFAARLGATGDKQPWLVSVALPIEATSPAEAVRLFWSYVQQLGPAELPTYVWPSGEELAMQAFVLGEESNQDPEEEDED